MLINYQQDIEELNKMQNIPNFVKGEEDRYFDRIGEIASNILRLGKKIILLSGPSASGKTTSSYLLQRALSKLGISSHVLNMDEFFFDMDSIPVVDGKPDIENICALDVDTIKKCLGEIIELGKTVTPQFDFVTHKRKNEWVEVDVPNNEVVLMEGIHALNPAITQGLDDDKIYRVYVHCSAEYKKNKETILNSEDVRLIRRIVRDDRDRGTKILDTVSMWGEVLKGEKKNITPYMELAHFHLNTSHAYEPMVYKSLLCDLYNSEVANNYELENIQVIKRLVNLLSYFNPLDVSTISPISVIREFVGEG